MIPIKQLIKPHTYFQNTTQKWTVTLEVDNSKRADSGPTLNARQMLLKISFRRGSKVLQDLKRNERQYLDSELTDYEQLWIRHPDSETVLQVIVIYSDNTNFICLSPNRGAEFYTNSYSARFWISQALVVIDYFEPWKVRIKRLVSSLQK